MLIRSLALGVFSTMFLFSLPASGLELKSEGEIRNLKHQVKPLEDRIPGVAYQRLIEGIENWETSSFEQKQELEKTILLLRALPKNRLSAIFADLPKEGKEERVRSVETVFEKLRRGEIETGEDQTPYVLVVVLGANSGRRLFDQQADLPGIWNSIRPFGFVLRHLDSQFPHLRTRWFAELLTGDPVRGIQQDGDYFKFRVPTILDVARKIFGEDERKFWLLSFHDGQIIHYDFHELLPEYQDRWAPAAVTSTKLVRTHRFVREKMRELKEKGQTPFEIQRNLKSRLTSTYLRLDLDFEDLASQVLLRDVIAEHGGQTLDSLSFFMRLGMRIFRGDPVAPRIAVVRLGDHVGVNQAKDLREKERRVKRLLNDHDEACLNLWRAFRLNPRALRHGSFLLINEWGGAIVCGPQVKPGTAKKRYRLKQIVPTVFRLLGVDPKKASAASGDAFPVEAIEEIFESER
jgi:hypothetical protein